MAYLPQMAAAANGPGFGGPIGGPGMGGGGNFGGPGGAGLPGGPEASIGAGDGPNFMANFLNRIFSMVNAIGAGGQGKMGAAAGADKILGLMPEQGYLGYNRTGPLGQDSVAAGLSYQGSYQNASQDPAVQGLIGAALSQYFDQDPRNRNALPHQAIQYDINRRAMLERAALALAGDSRANQKHYNLTPDDINLSRNLQRGYQPRSNQYNNLSNR